MKKLNKKNLFVVYGEVIEVPPAGFVAHEIGYQFELAKVESKGLAFIVSQALKDLYPFAKIQVAKA